MKTISTARSFDGLQGVYRHASASTGTDMTFAVYQPPQAAEGAVPVLVYLSGLTCTHENVMVKAGAQQWCARYGLALVMPDTSPRGEDRMGNPVPDVEEYDFGVGAGFYVDATQDPWARHYKMESYISVELLELMAQHFPRLDTKRMGITGHSMGGHGALTLALKHPDVFKTVSAFSPIVSPMNCPWGDKALSGYLGPDRASWERHDACALIDGGARVGEILVDQGTDDEFLAEQLKPELLEDACSRAGIPLTLTMRDGYDHSYFFISTFIQDHVRWAAERL